MLTVAEIDALQKSEKKTADKVADGAGLYLFVTKRSKVWKYLYRFDGKQNTFTIGKYPEVGPKEARKRLNEAKALVSSGVDPNFHKRQQISQSLADIERERIASEADMNTFKIVANKWLELHGHSWTDSHIEKLVGRLENHVFPNIGEVPVSKLTKKHTAAVVENIVKVKKFETASRIYQIMKSILTYANDRDLIDSVPMVSKKSLIPAYSSNKMHAITDEKVLGEFLRAINGYQGSFITQCALRMFVYLPIRQGEFRSAHWCEFDLERAVWTIPAAHRKLPKFEKNNPENFLQMPLAKQVVVILQELYQVTGEGLYVFPNQQSGKAGCMSENTINQAIHKLGYKGVMTAHGIRSTFSTLLNEQGLDARKIDMQLGHKAKDKVESRYNRAEFEKERREMMQGYADHIDRLRNDDSLPV